MRCLDARQQRPQVLEVKGLWPDDASARAFAQMVLSGSVAGLPPAVSVEVDGVLVAFGGRTYVVAVVDAVVDCIATDALCEVALQKGGFATSGRVVTCVCSLARARGVQRVYVSNSTAADAGSLADAVVTALVGACVKVYASEALDVAVVHTCPMVVVMTPPSLPPRAETSKKGLLGLLGLLGMVPLAVLACLLVCFVRRRRKLAEMRIFMGGLEPELAPVPCVAGSWGATGGAIPCAAVHPSVSLALQV